MRAAAERASGRDLGWFFDEADREHTIVALAPRLWYSDPFGVTVGARARSSYLGWLDGWDAGAALGTTSRATTAVTSYPGATSEPAAMSRLNLWLRRQNPTLPGIGRPLVGGAGGVAFMDGIVLADLARTWGLSRLLYARGPRVLAIDDATLFVGRGCAAWTSRAPLQRAIHASSADPFETLWNSWYRPRGALLERPGFNFVALGGAALRGYSPSLALGRVLAANAELTRRVRTGGDASSGRHSRWLSAWGDAAAVSSDYFLVPRGIADAGVGASLRGRLYDRDVRLHVDVPVVVTASGWATNAGEPGVHRSSVASRWTITLGDLW